MGGPVLLIATPAYGEVHPRFVQSLLATQALLPRHGIAVEWRSVGGDSLVSRARNHLVAGCLADPAATHILWIDSDISWQAEDVLRLLQFDVDFVCGLYRLKAMPSASAPLWERFAFSPLVTNNTGGAPFDPHTGLLEIKAAGTGFAMTKRTVYERMIAAYPETKIQWGYGTAELASPETTRWLYSLFPVEVVNGQLMGEDYGFCSRWRQLGGRIWADPSIQLTHYGAHAYQGNPMDMFRPAAELVA